jgi:hypothetical protein
MTMINAGALLQVTDTDLSDEIIPLIQDYNPDVDSMFQSIKSDTTSILERTRREAGQIMEIESVAGSELQEEKVKNANYTKLNRLLEGKDGLRIEQIHTREDIPEAVVKLAEKLVKMDSTTRDILRQLKKQYISKKKSFIIDLSDKNPGQIGEICNLFENMAGLVSNLEYSSKAKLLRGDILLTSKAQQFITGGYLEIAAFRVIEEEVRNLADKFDLETEVYRNVRIATCEGYLVNEFDVAIAIADKVFLIECKSGEHFSDWNKLSVVGAEYGVVPDRLLLLDTCLSTEKASIIEYFCEYYVAYDYDSLREKFREMVSKNFDI